MKNNLRPVLLTEALLTQMHRGPLQRRPCLGPFDFHPCGRKIANQGPCENSCTDICRTLKAPMSVKELFESVDDYTIIDFIT